MVSDQGVFISRRAELNILKQSDSEQNHPSETNIMLFSRGCHNVCQHYLKSICM